jgi:HAD superfamily hydrolase (TIGR01493 family)
VSRWAVFDLNGTLLDPAGIGAAALDRAILAAMTLNHVGEYRRFPELLAACGADVGVPMPAYPEAGRALDVLEGAGFALAVLTNSPTDVAETGLRAAGLRDRFAHVVGTDQVGAFKPDARVYRHGLAALGAAAADATMVAAHWWDLRGARAVGMRVAWVGRGEGTLNPLLGEPDARGADLLQTAMMLAGRTTEEAR